MTALRFVGPLLLASFALSCASHDTANIPAGDRSQETFGPARTQTVTLLNSELRRDATGEVVDAHDGCLQCFEGHYYLYGTAYGKSSGFSINHRFRVYSSSNLGGWTFQGDLLQAPPDGVYYRPYVVFNARTHKYVLFYNWYPKLWDGQLGVAVSDTPYGPFTIANANVTLSQAKFQPGDGSPFVDADGTGYFIYTVIGQDHSIRVEQLTPDFLGSAGKYSEVLGKNCEAPVLFRRNGLYYALFDTCCCFCPPGSGARVLIAKDPLGPYKELGNINRQPGSGANIIDAQQTWVAQIPTDSASEPAFIWMGDRWGSRPDGVKGHDYQYWSPPMEFLADGTIAPLRKVNNWELKLKTVRAAATQHAIYNWPKKKDPNPLTKDPCSGKPIDPAEFDGL